MSSLLTSLIDYSRQRLQVGTPPHYIFGADNKPVNKELLQLSLLQRIANALEGHDGTLTALVAIQPRMADEFRDLVGDLDGRPGALAIVGWELRDADQLVVALAYEEGDMLFVLGRYWECLTAKEGSQGRG